MPATLHSKQITNARHGCFAQNPSGRPKPRHFDRSAQRGVEKPPHFPFVLATLRPRQAFFAKLWDAIGLCRKVLTIIVWTERTLRMLRAMSSALSKAFVCTALVLSASSISLCQSAPAKPDTAAPLNSPTPHLTFDVASIREAHDGNMSYFNNPAQTSYLHGERVRVAALIFAAYQITAFRFLEKLPDWAMTVPYNVTAKSDPATDEALAKLNVNDAYAAKRLMLQQLLAERFKLQMHQETRISTVYDFVATSKTGTLMTPVHGELSETLGTCPGAFIAKGRDINSKGCPFKFLINTVQQELGTTVTNKTGLQPEDLYAYHLMWDPRPTPPADDQERFPQLRDALREQLGLELQPRKGPVTYWVVDHVERPTED